MTFKNFIKKYRKQIDVMLEGSLYKNDEERRALVLNDDGLYLLAKSEGVRI